MNPIILEASFGYDMTINHYFKIVKAGEKTVIVQRVGGVVSNDDGLGGGKSIADSSKTIGEPFRAFIRNRFDRKYYVSKYFPGGSATEWDGKPSYYNTWD